MNDKKELEEVIEDKGFNDSELEDIMNEIEELEKDFAEESKKKQVDELSEALGIEEEVVDMSDLRVEDVEIGKTELQQVIDDEVESIIREEIDNSAQEEIMDAIEDKIISFEENRPSHESSMDFSVAGQMELKLNFNVGGQLVHIYLNEKEGLTIEMDGGAKFTIPMGFKKAS